MALFGSAGAAARMSITLTVLSRTVKSTAAASGGVLTAFESKTLCRTVTTSLAFPCTAIAPPDFFARLSLPTPQTQHCDGSEAEDGTAPKEALPELNIDLALHRT